MGGASARITNHGQSQPDDDRARTAQAADSPRSACEARAQPRRAASGSRTCAQRQSAVSEPRRERPSPSRSPPRKQRLTKYPQLARCAGTAWRTRALGTCRITPSRCISCARWITRSPHSRAAACPLGRCPPRSRRCARARSGGRTCSRRSGCGSGHRLREAAVAAAHHQSNSSGCQAGRSVSQRGSTRPPAPITSDRRRRPAAPPATRAPGRRRRRGRPRRRRCCFARRCYAPARDPVAAVGHHGGVRVGLVHPTLELVVVIHDEHQLLRRRLWPSTARSDSSSSAWRPSSKAQTITLTVRGRRQLPRSKARALARARPR